MIFCNFKGRYLARPRACDRPCPSVEPRQGVRRGVIIFLVVTIVSGKALAARSALVVSVVDSLVWPGNRVAVTTTVSGPDLRSSSCDGV